MIGTLLNNRYRIEVRLGEGGMGVVYKAHDTLLDRPVAIKSLSPQLVDTEALKRLLREAQAAAKLTHPNVTAVYDVLEDGDRRMIVMEFVEGQTLRKLIPLPWERAVAVALDVCRALSAAHERGIVHRDIKPENIIVTSDGTAKVMDFGLARSAGRSRLTQSGMIVGTVAYIAPEQALQGIADARSDWYSLGCVLYETLTGRPPFESDDPVSVISQHLAAAPIAPRSRNMDVPPALNAIIMKLLAKDPSQRYVSAATLADALHSVKTPEAEVAPAAPTVLESLRRSRFVGRDRELTELKTAVDRMLSGDGGVILVVGEPGIGKTRLCEELTVYARLRGCRVWSGYGHERETAIPYWLFIDVFRAARRELTAEDWQTIVSASPQIARVLPDLPHPTAAVALPAEQEKIRLFEQVAQLLEAWAQRFPMVLLLDDLHWADPATLDLFHHLARALKGHRILLLGTYRDVEVDLQHPLSRTLGDMNRERLYQRVLLRRLDEVAVRTMMAASFNDAVAEALLAPVYEETEGNPFFVEEILLDLVEAGAISQDDGTWNYKAHAWLRVPESIREAVGRRLARLSEACRQSLTVASVVGREFAFDVTMSAAGVDEDTLLSHVDEALRAHLIQEAKSSGAEIYSFQHALIRETLYESLNPRRRARLHRQVGEACERVFAGREEMVIDDLAYHFGRAEQSQTEKGIRYNLQAAEHAVAVYAHEAAEQRLRVALELADGLGKDDLAAEIHERLGLLYMRIQQGTKAAVEFDLALHATARAGPVSDERAVALQLKIAEACARYGGQHPDARKIAESLRDSALAASDSRLLTLALGYLSRLQLRNGEYQEALQTALQALPLAEALDDPKVTSYMYRHLSDVYWELGDWDKGYAAVLRPLERLRQEDDLVELWNVHADVAAASMISGRYKEAEKHAELEMEFARKIQSPRAIANALYALSWVYHGTGRWRESVRHGEEGLSLGQRVGVGEGSILYLRMWVGLSAAYLSDEAMTRRQVAACEQLSPAWKHGQRNFVQARLLLALADLEGAARHVEAMPAEWPPCAQCQDLYRLVNGEFYARVGEPDKAEASAREVLRPEAGRRLWFEGEAHYGLGLAALARRDPHKAIEEFETARDILNDVGHIWTLAMSWRELGQAYAMRNGAGDPSRAYEAFLQSQELLLRHGATSHAERVAALGRQGSGPSQ